MQPRADLLGRPPLRSILRHGRHLGTAGGGERANGLLLRPAPWENLKFTVGLSPFSPRGTYASCAI
jgi:hypothetical protein